MDDRAAVVLGALAGAVVGGAFGYLYLSEDGRRVREDIEPQLAELVTELQRAWEAAERARDAVQVGWSTVRQVESTPTPVAPASDGK